jgi:hypothetical protein
MRVSAAAVALLREAARKARLEGCGVDEDAKEKMRLYLETWVANRIDGVIEYLEGETTAERLAYENCMRFEGGEWVI